MCTHVLVPVESLDHLSDAVAVASHLIDTPVRQLTLLHVIPANASTQETLEMNDRLDRFVADLRAQGIDARAVIESGAVPTDVTVTAAYAHCDLIVLMPHSRSGLKKLQQPSVTEHMLSHSTAPLLIWPERAPVSSAADMLAAPGSEVLVPLDGSEVAEQALPLALAWARHAARPLLLLRVVPRVSLVGGAESYRLARQLEHDNVQEARRYLASLREQLAEHFTLPIETMVKIGEPARTIRRAASLSPSGVIVLCTHGRSGLQKWLLGSVTSALMRHTPVPLLVVNAHAPAMTLPSPPAPSATFQSAQPSSPVGTKIDFWSTPVVSQVCRTCGSERHLLLPHSPETCGFENLR